MFAGGKRRSSSNVRIMQLFHELKAQFPTIPDHIITSCVTSHIVSSGSSINNENLYDLVLAKIGKEQINQMGRSAVQVDTPPFIPSPTIIVKKNHQFLSEPSSSSSDNSERIISISEMNHSESGDNNNNNNNNSQFGSEINNKKSSDLISVNSVVAKRPDTLDIINNINNNNNKSRDKNDRKLQLSEKCKDVFKLLNSPGLADKPPRSPLSVKRFAAKAPRKDSPTQQSSAAVLPFNNNNNNKKETVSTPTQTTDTLVNNNITPSSIIISPSLNLSLNVNYQMGLTQSPPSASSSSSLSVIKPRCTAKVDLSPTQPWLNPNPALNGVDPLSPRSFTTVNLTLRPPTSNPQNPIDITSQNSSLTYSTSSFDKENGLQSRLQITVGPGNTGTVSSVRTRPRSYHMGENCTELVNNSEKATSLTNLASIGSAADPVLLKQQIRIDRMRIELQTGNKRLVIMRQEVKELEKNTRQVLLIDSTAEELEKQIKMEIKHLTAQCEQLAALFDNDQFYSNIYTGPSGPLLLPQQRQRSISSSSSTSRPQQQQQQQQFIQRPILDFSEVEGPKWNCSVCTFLNHPYLDKCEQCDMRRVHHQSMRRFNNNNNNNNSLITIDGLDRQISNSANNLSVSFDSFKKSMTDALKKSSNAESQSLLLNSNNAESVTVALTSSEMLKRLQINSNININNNASINNGVPYYKLPVNANPNSTE